MITRLARQIVACALGVAFTASCSSSTTHEYRVSGVVRGYGGPAIVVDGKARMADDGNPMQHQAVTAQGADGSKVLTRTDQNGRFTFLLPSGRYQVAASCGLPVDVTVPDANAAAVALRCDFP